METKTEINTILIDNNRSVINYRDLYKKYNVHWKMFLLSIFLSLILAFLYLRYTPYQYEVSATILIDDKENGGLASEISAFQDIDVLKGTRTSVINEIGVLKSRSLVEGVIKQLQLNVSYFEKGRVNNSEVYNEKIPFRVNFFIRDSIFFDLDTVFLISAKSESKFEIKTIDNKVWKEAHFGKNISTAFGDINITPIRPEEVEKEATLIVNIAPFSKVVDSYRKRISIEPEANKSSVLVLSLTDPVKKKAQDILNRMIDNYNKNAINYKNLITSNTDEFINERIDKISEDLSIVDKGVEDFKTKNKLTDMEFETNLVLSSNSVLETKIVDLNAQIKLVNYVKDYITVHESDLIPLNLGLKDESTNENTVIYNRLLMERNRVIMNSSVKNPTVINLDAQISNLRNSIFQSLNNLGSSLEFALREAKNQELSLNRKRQLAPQQERQFQDIKRKQQIVETLYLYLLQKKEENAISLGLPVPNAVIVDRANGSDKPVSPKKLIIYLASIIFGLFVPFTIISVRLLFDNKIHTINQLKELTNAPILGDIPHTDSKLKIVLSEDERSNVSESFRLLRTNLNFMFSKVDEDSKSIFLTSTLGNEGKTFVSINLSSSLSANDKKVLLICADLRKPKLMEYLNIESRTGLSNYLADKSLELKDVIFTVKEAGFDIIESGEIPPNPAELLLNKRFEEVITYGKNYYDYVIVDTPPVSLITDTLLISKFADLFVFVVRANFLDKNLLVKQNELYEKNRLPNMAILLNDTDDDKRGYRYGYGEHESSKKWWKV